MNKYDISDQLKKILKKISKKDKQLYEQIIRKINEIIKSNNFEHYKNLQHDMKGLKRTHIGPFVLLFEIKDDRILFYDFNHHDKIY